MEPGGLTPADLTRDTSALLVCEALLFFTANSPASINVSFGSSGPTNRMTTWEPGQPAACIHQSEQSRCFGLQLSSSLSSAFRPTRILMPSMDVYVKYGERGLEGFPFALLGTSSWSRRGASLTSGGEELAQRHRQSFQFYST